MTQKDFVVSGDGHLLEPIDLFKTRLPAHLRDRAVWEEDFELDEPWVDGGATVFRRLHTATTFPATFETTHLSKSVARRVRSID